MCNLIILVIVFCNGLLWLFLSNGCLSLGWCETDVQRRCDPPSTGWTIREEARNIGELFFCLSMESEDLLFTKLYVLQHMFREPEKRPLTAVSNFFTVLVALPFLVLLVLVSLLLLKYSERSNKSCTAICYISGGCEYTFTLEQSAIQNTVSSTHRTTINCLNGLRGTDT